MNIYFRRDCKRRVIFFSMIRQIVLFCVANVYEVVNIYCEGILLFRWNKVIDDI